MDIKVSNFDHHGGWSKGRWNCRSAVTPQVGPDGYLPLAITQLPLALELSSTR